MQWDEYEKKVLRSMLTLYYDKYINDVEARRQLKDLLISCVDDYCESNAPSKQVKGILKKLNALV